MWHEARKQERRIRGLIVDYRRRAERRQDFYEKIQADPTQFIQTHGRRCKIHLDPAVAAAGDGAAIIVPWQGQQDNLIDRFDVRAHLDYIPPVPKSTDADNDLTQEERQYNYERFRILAQNDFLNITEEKFLHQLYLEEQYGANAAADSSHSQAAGKKKPTQKFGAAIGYSYDDHGESLNEIQPFSHLHTSAMSSGSGGRGAASGSQSTSGFKRTKDENDSETESESDIDMDVSIDVTKLDTSQAHELNACGRNYGMLSNDFYSYLTKDADEADALRIAREEQREKMLLSGRKSRRERKAQKERRIASRPLSPPSYAAKEDTAAKAEDSDSRSPSPPGTTDKITYITSFGGEDELQPHSKISINLSKKTPGTTVSEKAEPGANKSVGGKAPSYADKLKENLDKAKAINENPKKYYRRRHSMSSSRSRSRSGSYGRKRRSYRRSRSHSYGYYKKYRDERRTTHSRSRSPIRNRSKSRGGHHHYHTAATTHKYRSSSRKSRSRSKSRRKRFSYRFSSSSSTSSTYSRTKHYHKSRRSPKLSKSSSFNKRRSRSFSEARHTPRKHHHVTPAPTIEKSQKQQQQIEFESVSRDIKEASPQIAASIVASAASSVALPTPVVAVIEPPPPPLKRYYGRKREQCSSSSLSSDDTESIEEKTMIDTTEKAHDCTENMDIDTTSEKSNPLPSTSSTSIFSMEDSKQAGKYSTISSSIASHSNAPEIKSSSGCGRLNLRERLKRKMQNLLNKQYKADKKAEIEKTEREKQLQQEREEEMRELALKLRRRQRELRHRHGSTNSVESESGVSESALAACSKSKSSKSRSIEHPEIITREREDRRSVLRRVPSREHRRSGSRSRGYSRQKSQYKSRSRSHSKRRRRSVSRSRQQRERSRERWTRCGNEKKGFGERFARRSRSRSRSVHRYGRDRNRERSSRRYHGREERSRDRDRYQNPPAAYQYSSVSYAPTDSSTAATSRGSRIVISAPPKLKKLVDY